MILFVLIILFVGMLLLNLVEEKLNKVIEVLVVVVLVDVIFFGKFVVMFGVLLIGIMIWGMLIVGGVIVVFDGGLIL